MEISAGFLKNQTLPPPRFWDLWACPICPNTAEKQLFSLITLFIIGIVFKKFSLFFRFEVNFQPLLPKKPFIPALSLFSALAGLSAWPGQKNKKPDYRLGNSPPW